ncbi:GNAT family N-acetyltransferase [Kitasatospora sp. NPDC096147]|uniref:GNAT family N-acetyltransferase n=1 Tax=Kitasatospora sp. NPDC096147 TaxID=3364093 RepID=UPI0038151853
MPARAMTSTDVLVSQGGPDIEEVRVRQATAEDAEVLAGLIRAHRGTDGLPPDGSFPARDGSRAEDFCLVEHQGEPVACCAADRRADGTAELYDLVVDPRWRGTGTGRLALAGLFLALRAEQATGVTVTPGPARAWFTALGFTEHPEHGPEVLGRATVDGHDEVHTLGLLGGLRIEFARSGRQVEWDPSATALLQFSRGAQVKTDSRCWAGVCGTCAVRIRRGTVTYDMEPGYEPQDGEVLLCVSRPTTDLVLDL